MITFNDILATSVILELPRTGQWVADITFDNLLEEDILKLKVGLKSNLIIDSQYWVGTIISSSTVDWKIKCRVLGGAGTMTKPTKAGNVINSTTSTTTNNIIEKPVNDIEEDPSKKTVENNTINQKAEQAPENTIGRALMDSLEDSVKYFISHPLPPFPGRVTLEKYLGVGKKSHASYEKEDNIKTSLEVEGKVTQQLQTLEGVESGKQLDKILKIATSDKNTTWRINRDGDIVYVKDLDKNNITLFPEGQLSKEDFSGNIHFNCFNLTIVPEPGSYIITNTETWRVEHTTIFSNYEKHNLVVYKRPFNSTVRNMVNTKHEDSFAKNYSAIIHVQNSDGTVNLIPDDDLIKGSGVANIPIISPFGVTVKVEPGVRAIIQYENNDPTRPYIVGFKELTSSQHTGYTSANYYLTVGDTSTAQLVALSNKVDAEIQRLWDHLTTTFAVLANDGGATMQTNAIAAANAAKLLVTSTASKRLKVE